MSIRLPIILAISFLVAPIAAAQTPTSKNLADFLEARMAADRGDTGHALELLGKLVATQPEDPILRYERARVLAATGRLNDAERDLEVSIKLDPAFADARKLYGRILLDQSNNDRRRVERALEQLSVAWQINPNDISTGLTVAQILSGLGRVEQSAGVLEGIIERLPDNRTVNYQYAQTLLQLDRTEDAIKALEVVVGQDPLYPPAAQQLVEIYQTADRWGDAADLLGRLSNLDPANKELLARRAVAMLRADRTDEARAELQRLSRENPSDLRLRFLLAEAMSDAGQDKEAEAIYEALIKERPNEPDFLMSYGFNQLRLEKLDSAETRFQRVLALANVPPRMRNLAATQLAAIAHDRKDYDTALSRARGVISSEGATNRQALAIALDVLRQRKDWKGGLDLIRERIKVEPDDRYLRARLLQFQLLSGDDKAATKTVNALMDDSVDASLLPGQVFAELDRWDDMIAAARRSMAKWGETSSGLFQLASALERSQHFDESVATFEKLLAAYPDHTPAQNYLGYMLADRGVRLQAALELIQKAVDKEPRNGAYVDSLGWVYYRLGNLAMAERHMLDAVELMGQDAVVHDHLADVFAAEGKFDRAIDSYEQALELNPEDPVAIRSKIETLREKIAASREK